MFPKAEALLEATARVVEECECEEGCPSCIHSPRCGSGNRPLDKQAVRRTLRLVLSGEALPRASGPRDPAPPTAPRPRPAPAAPPPLFLDVETQRSALEVGGWHNIHLMRIALAVVHDASTGAFETYDEAAAERLIARLFAAPLVVGFNVRRFDYAVLGAYTARRLAELPTFDLLDDVFLRLGRRLSLGHLAEATLGREKSGDGLQSLEWFRAGEIARVEAYCRRDVELLRDLFDFGQREGHVRFRTREGELVRLPVRWDAETLHAHVRPRAEPEVVRS
jgi:DEAD/DEAH box helicase domain-containing protein